MTSLPKDPIHELKAVLAKSLSWHGARISFLAQFLLALFKVRSVNLAELATGSGGSAKVDSHNKCLKRFFCSFEIGYGHLAHLLVRLFPVGNGPWRLTMERTNRQLVNQTSTFSCWASLALVSPCRPSGVTWLN